MNKNTILPFLALLIFWLTLAIPAQGQQIEAVSQIIPTIPAGPNERSRSLVASRDAQQVKPAEKVDYPRRRASAGWQNIATVSGIAYRIKFINDRVGYLSGGSGLVYKTQDGGQSWQVILQTGSTHHWYGLAARGSLVMVAGFNNNANASDLGIMRISRDSGEHWSAEISISKTDWLMNLEFGNRRRALLVTNPWSAQPDGVFYSFYGGLKSSDWRAATPTAADGWFGNQMSVLPSGQVAISGINYCTSRNFGITWSCRRSIDSVFDGAVFFSDDQHGWVGGGTISPSQTGWVHSTSNGGQNWSARILTAPFAIRNIYFLNNSVGWAMGGNYYAGIGGIYRTIDGGDHWTLDLETPQEMVSCDKTTLENGRTRVWCVGYGRNAATNSSESKIFVIDE